MKKRTRAEMRAELQQKADALIDELLDWNEQTHEPTLTQIEDIVLKLRQRLGEQMAATMVDAQASVESVPGPQCPTCGQEMHSKAVKDKRVASRVGSLGVHRVYYYCETCRQGFFPPGPSAPDSASGVE